MAAGNHNPRADTLCAAFQDTVLRHPGEVALRSTYGSTRLTFGEYAARVKKVTAGLAKLGVVPGETVALMMTNRPEFNICDTAVLHAGATPFSIYNTASPEQISYVLTHGGARVALCEKQFLPQLECAIKRTQVEHLVCIDGNPEGSMSLDQLETSDRGEFAFEQTWRAVSSSHLATIIYTSGTTGPPKGVELTHGNLIAQLRAVNPILPVSRDDVVISYLPGAHIADRCFCHYYQMAFGLEVVSHTDVRTIEQAVQQVRPTVFIGPPHFWEKLKTSAERTIREAHGNPHFAGQPVVRSNLAWLGEVLGLDQLRWAIISGAPSRRDLLEFLLDLGVPLTETWGSSELSCIATTTTPADFRIGSVGRPVPGMEISFADDGEILCRGKCVMRGYRGDPERTREAIDTDGWFHTGDLGAMDKRGYLTLTGRKKDIIISSTGKNMSPSNIEDKLRVSCEHIAHAVCIGDSRPYNVALIVVQPDSPSDAVGGVSAEKTESISLAVRSVNAGLSRIEQIRRFHLLASSWEPGGDELTLTGKLKRSAIAEKYASVIDDLYRQGTGPEPAPREDLRNAS